MSSAATLENLVSQIASNGIEVVDLTNTLSADFPVLTLPEEFAQCAPFKRETISHYDDKGPMWSWANISMNEHTGTHCPRAISSVLPPSWTSRRSARRTPTSC